MNNEPTLLEQLQEQLEELEGLENLAWLDVQEMQRRLNEVVKQKNFVKRQIEALENNTLLIEINY